MLGEAMWVVVAVDDVFCGSYLRRLDQAVHRQFIIIIYIVILLPYPHLLHGLRQVRPLAEDLHLE